MKSASWRQQVPEFLRFLEDRFSHRIRLHLEELGFDIFLVDFSEWKLRLSDRTPVVVVRPVDLAGQPADVLAESVTDVIRAHNYAHLNPLVLVEGDGEDLRKSLRIGTTPILVLDKFDQVAVQNSRRPTAELLQRLSRQVELSTLAPYETSKPVTGSRFFGRSAFIRRILASEEANFAIVGIRRIGKTSLLTEIGERLRSQVREASGEQAAERIIFMDCSAIRSAEHFMQEVVRKLQPRELTRIRHRHFPLYFPDFLARMSRQYGGPLVFLLDEFDALLTATAVESELLDGLRASSNMGHARFIVAGFRHLLQETSNLESPFFNFAKPLRLKEFTRSEAAEMIVSPMRHLGIRFEQQNDVVDQIFEETAGQPNLIQFYCSILIETMDQSGERLLSPEQLFDVYTDENFRSFVLNTFMDNTNHLEKAIVFAVMAQLYPEQTRFDLEAIDNALASRNVEGPMMDLDQACRNLELAGIFIKQGWNYQFATPVFPRILSEGYNVDYLFRKVIQEGIW